MNPISDATVPPEEEETPVLKRDIKLPADIQLWPVERLIPYERNPRTHSPEQITSIANSIREFGFTNPILVDESKGILAGHGRLRAAIEVGMDLVPVIELSHLTEAQKRAYIIADNKLALDAGWEDALLKSEIEALRSMDFNTDLTGFTHGELTNLFLEREFGETDVHEEWSGMPEFENQDMTAYRRITINFQTQEAVDAFAALNEFSITDKTDSLWVPPVGIAVFRDKSYE